MERLYRDGSLEVHPQVEHPAPRVQPRDPLVGLVHESNFGIWSPEQKNVKKYSVKSRICCCAWTNDGTHLTLGHFNGTISLYNKDGEEKNTIERPSGAPIWCLQWKPAKDDQPYDVLAVGCWDQTLSFYQISGAQIKKDRKIGFDPCCLQYCGDGEYLIIGGATTKRRFGPRRAFV